MKAMCAALVPLLTALWMALLAMAAQAQPQTQPTFRAVAPVTLTAGEGLQRLTLPLPVLLASRSAGYADVRLTGADGQALPIAWAQPPAAPPPAQRTVAVPRFVWPERPAGGTTVGSEATRIRIDTRGAVVEVQTAQGKKAALPPSNAASRWLLDLSQSRQPKDHIERVLLNWPARPGGVSTQVQVEASDDAVSWQAVTTAALLELPGAAGSTVSLKHIDWPATATASPRYVRLTFDAPQSLSSTDVRWTQGATTAPQPSEAFEFAQQAPQPPSNESAWAVDLGGRLPVTQIELLDTPLNTVSALRLEQRDDPAQAWQSVTSFVAWRLQRQGAVQRSPVVALAAASSAARYWRLVSDGRTSSPGGAALKVKLSWAAPQLVFAATSAQGTELRVGFDKAAAATVHLSTLMPGYETGAEHKLPAATAGALVAVPWRESTLMEQLTSPTPQQRKQWLLWAVLAVAVVGLGVLAIRLSGDIKASTK